MFSGLFKVECTLLLSHICTLKSAKVVHSIKSPSMQALVCKNVQLSF